VIAPGIQNTSTNAASKNTPAAPANAGQPAESTVEEHDPQSLSANPGALLSTAKLLERMGETELRLGIRGGELGSVDIRTSMAHNQFTAQISVERGDLGRAMAADLPNLESRLSEKSIPVGNIVLQNYAGENSGASEQQKPREQATSFHSPATVQEENVAAPVAAPVMTSSAYGSRLDVHM
jgi:flagellar hook-length control protein FliK